MKRGTMPEGMKKGLLVLGLSLMLAPLVPAAEALRAVRVQKAPELDGDLSDAIWEKANPFSGFLMVEPEPNGQPSEKTILRVLYDESSLYIGVFCQDREPSRISAYSMAHDDPGDEHSTANDIIRILLDPFQDRRNAYIFFINARGGRSEGLAYGEHYSLDWDGIWDAKSRILKNGWSAEIRIPFKTISFKPGLKTWGINVERYIARKQETIRLAGTNRDNFFYNPVEAAALEGIRDIKQGLGFTFRPYALGSALKDHVSGALTATKMDGGFDIYKNFTPNFVGAFSYNTDFAETEVDERRINLTRFPLWFPEKRMFFLEGSDIFSFASTESFVPFFSRRIGLVNGQQVPVVFGTKLYGKIGNTNLALVDVRTDTFGSLPGRNYLAARLSRNIFNESKIGWIFTNGSPAGGRNSLAGMDFTYQTSRLAGNKNFLVSGWYAYNWNELERGRHDGFGFRLDYPNDLWDIASSYANYGDSLDPGLGFLPRKGIQTAFGHISFQPRPKKGLLGGLVRQFFFDIGADVYWNLSGRLETRELQLSPLSFVTESGEHFEFGINPTRDVLPYDFEVSPGIVIPSGAYDFTEYQIEFSSANHRPVVLDAEWKFGDFYSGRYDNAQVGLTLKYKGYATLTLSTDLVRGRLPQGDFNENVYQIKADFFLSPDLGIMNYVQYDDISRELGWSARLRWRLSPGNEIYLVYNKNWERRWNPLSRFIPLEERGVLKITFSIRP
jgi:hypothetical protein